MTFKETVVASVIVAIMAIGALVWVGAAGAYMSDGEGAYCDASQNGQAFPQYDGSVLVCQFDGSLAHFRLFRY